MVPRFPLKLPLLPSFPSGKRRKGIFRKTTRTISMDNVSSSAILQT
jgi:hypothetical protein